MTTATQTAALISTDTSGKGVLLVRIAKLTHTDDQVVARGSHSVMLVPGMDVAATMADVNAALVDQGYTALSAEDVATIQSVADATWTPECIAAYQAGIGAV